MPRYAIVLSPGSNKVETLEHRLSLVEHPALEVLQQVSCCFFLFEKKKSHTVHWKMVWKLGRRKTEGEKAARISVNSSLGSSLPILKPLKHAGYNQGTLRLRLPGALVNLSRT